MDAFDDAFGETPTSTTTGEGSESILKTNGNGFLLEDDDDEADPAADFLAREQDNFVGLEDEIPVVVGGGEDTLPVSNGDYSNGNLITEDFSGDNDLLNDDFLSQPRASSPFSSSSPQTVFIQREEPEKIKIWREEQKRRLELKDCEEEENKEKLRAAAKKELDEWYKTYDDQISKTRNTNRSAEQEGAAEVNHSGGEEGKEWEQIANLCDFNPKSTKQQKDISRMRSLILQLKQNPPVQRQSKAGSSKAS